jgi:Ca2+-binding EF-hand superfamily protein
VTAVGAFIYLSSKQAYNKLYELHTQNLTDKDIETHFKKHDKNGDGKLDTDELGSLCRELGRPLTRNEMESAIFELDADGSGFIEMNELLEWWKNRV